MNHRDQIFATFLEWVRTVEQGGFLIVAGSNGAYVQFQKEDTEENGEVLWEAVSNEYLEQSMHLNDAQDAAVKGMGFRLNGNYQRFVRAPRSDDEVRSLADTCATMFHTVYLVPEDDPLKFTLSSDGHNLNVR